MALIIENKLIRKIQRINPSGYIGEEDISYPPLPSEG